jgi:hypothetical protein
VPCCFPIEDIVANFLIFSVRNNSSGFALLQVHLKTQIYKFQNINDEYLVIE